MKLDQTCRIFTYLLYSMARVAQYAETDARARLQASAKRGGSGGEHKVAGNILCSRCWGQGVPGERWIPGSFAGWKMWN